MDTNIRYLNESDYDEWDRLVKDSDHGTIFHTSTWNLELASYDPYLHFSLVGCFLGENLIGGVVILWKKAKKLLKVIVQPYATPFYGIVLKERDTEYLSKAESQRQSVIMELIEFLEKEFDHITTSFPPSFIDVRPLAWKGFRTNVKYTYRGEISSLDKALPAVKRQIKKGEKLDYSIRTGLDEEHIKLAYSLILKSYDRQNHAFGFSEKTIIDFLQNQKLSGKFRVYSISLGEDPVASIIMLLDKEVSYYWLAGGDHQYFNSGLNQLLLKNVLQELEAEGIKQFDFLGANTKSIAEYKARFNVDLVPYYYLTKASGTKARLLLGLKELFS